MQQYDVSEQRWNYTALITLPFRSVQRLKHGLKKKVPSSKVCCRLLQETFANASEECMASISRVEAYLRQAEPHLAPPVQVSQYEFLCRGVKGLIEEDATIKQRNVRQTRSHEQQ